MTLLKYIKSTVLIFSLSLAASSCRDGRMDFDSSQIPLVNDGDGVRQDEKTEDSNETNHHVAAEPAAVAGAYLFDCTWVGEAESKAIGIGSCRANDPAMVASGKLEAIELAMKGSTIQTNNLPSSAPDTILFEVSHQVYGQPTTVTIVWTQDGETIRIEGMKLKNLPSAPPPPAVVSFALNTFKLGDDGPTGSALCTGLQNRAASNGFYGTAAQMDFEVTSSASDVKIILSRICGNGAGIGGSFRLAQIEVRRAGDNSLVSSVPLPASSLGNDLADGADPTASYTSLASLAKGHYTVQVIVGLASNASALDDLVIDLFQISGTNLVLNSKLIK